MLANITSVVHIKIICGVYASACGVYVKIMCGTSKIREWCVSYFLELYVLKSFVRSVCQNQARCVCRNFVWCEHQNFLCVRQERTNTCQSTFLYIFCQESLFINTEQIKSLILSEIWYILPISTFPFRVTIICRHLKLPYSHQISPHLNFRPPGELKWKRANWAPKLGEGRKLKGANWAPKIGGAKIKGSEFVTEIWKIWNIVLN